MFLGTLRGKSPQEVIGIVSSSLLIQSTAIATAITIVLMAAFTVGPYLIWGPPKGIPAQAPAAAVAPTTPTTAAVTSAAKAEAKSDGTLSSENTAKAVKAMGMDETKTADPKANPLEKDFDKLLDGAK